jgi:UDP-N-acetylmuramate dehydrogenase
MSLPKSLSRKLRNKVKLAPFTSFKIGGAARYFLEAKNINQLQEALFFAKHAAIPVFILGSGSNILISDSGLNGLVIKLSGKNFKQIRSQGVYLESGAGIKLSQLILYAKNNGLSGLEFLTGIPGTLGGALAGNAGAWGKSIGQQVRGLRVLDHNGKIKLLKAGNLKFAYRKSNLDKYVIISAKLKLRKVNEDAIALGMREYLLQRENTQNNNLPSAGCIFKNPGKYTAGRLIHACGLKGYIMGGAVISNSHANFILNKGKAKSKDVLFLMDLMQKKVKARFKVNLKPEIKIWK